MRGFVAAIIVLHAATAFAGDVALESVGVNGELREEDVRPVVERSLALTRICYAKAVFKTPTLGGRVRVDLSVRANGTISKLGIDTKGALGDCVRKPLAKLRLARSRAGGSLVVVVLFTPPAPPPEPPTSLPTVTPPTAAPVKPPVPPASQPASQPVVVAPPPPPPPPKGLISVKDVKVSVGNPKDVRKAFVHQMDQMIDCYEKRLVVNATLQGELVVTFQIDVNGAAPVPKATGIPDAELVRCIDEAVKAATYPKGAAPVDVTITLKVAPAR